MNLQWQIQIINDMIREDPDATIAEYLALIKDITSIEQQEEIDSKVTRIEQEIKKVIKTVMA